MGLGLGPFQQVPGVSAIGEDALDGREASAGPLEHAFRTVAVLNVGGVDLDGEQPSVGVGQDVPPAAVDLLAGVEPFKSPF